YFVVDMRASGVETRPLRQMTGQAEFNEVYLNDVRIPDAHRLGAIGAGWQVAMTTLMNERGSIGASGIRRGAGTVADAVALWAQRPDRHTAVRRDRLAQLWLRSELQRLTSQRARATATVRGPGPEGSIAKLVGAELNQQVYEFCMDLLGPEGTLYGDYTMRVVSPDDDQGPVQQRFLRSRANTIEGGTSEVLRNILGERILGLPGDPRADSGRTWREVPPAGPERKREPAIRVHPGTAAAAHGGAPLLRRALRRVHRPAADGVHACVRPKGLGPARFRAGRARARCAGRPRR